MLLLFLHNIFVFIFMNVSVFQFTLHVNLQYDANMLIMFFILLHYLSKKHWSTYVKSG